MSRRPKRNEELLQRAVSQFLDRALPQNAVWWHTPNGGARTAAEAGIFKALGVKPGIPDIFILYCGTLHGLELKAPPRKPTPLQIGMGALLVDAGAKWAWADNIEDVEAQLRAWGFPLRASLGAAA